MSSLHQAAVVKIEDPGPAQFPPWLRPGWLLAAGVGVVLTILGIWLHPHRAWSGYLVSYLYFLILSLAGVFLVALEYATSATWSVAFRRLAEALTRFLPIAFLATIVFLFGFHYLYPWAQPGFHFHRASKQVWYNPRLVSLRALIYVGLWTLFGWLFVRRSLRMDEAWRRGESTACYLPRRAPGGFGKLPSPIGRLSAGFIVLFAVTFTMAAFDWVMSLEPRWNTTMYGVYLFAGLFEAGWAIVLLMAVLLRRRGSLGRVVGDHHYVDLSRMLHAFSIFMVYIGFEQYLLIWYANFPSETFYYHQRITGGWGGVFLFLLFAKWVFPFTVLLNQKVRKNEAVLLTMAALVLVGEWVDLYWLVMPATHANFHFPGWISLGEMLAFLGLFGLVVTGFLSRHSTVPVGDPRLAHSVAGDYL